MTNANPNYKRQTFRVPTWALGYIYNADAEGLTLGEELEIQRFQSSNDIVIFGEYGEEYFAHGNDVSSVNCNVVDVECLTLPA